MIVLHEAERTDGKGIVKGFITKMYGQYHIILEDDENRDYPVIEETIKPYFSETTSSITSYSPTTYEEFEKNWIENARRKSIDINGTASLVQINTSLYVYKGGFKSILAFNKKNYPGEDISLIAEFNCGNLIDGKILKKMINSKNSIGK
ncbi:hypothetical protein FDC64_11320 [Clostridium botulinum]|uniref:hypothetical protein n=1 Tax=Clostridium botulinum TaxID=1491 RepID=UPI0004D0361D|nr:hypothetical protein [Clostridium botulinum]MBY6773671.1 hypothetical protein [Clostridium botulinum]MBY6864287.1 hypothetical protein [Clostridium botulinum]MBY6984835.1 hypothetical protein [Clostridium botulinum]NFP26147.1 hypothetical protein [Clostridium botulinum]